MNYCSAGGKRGEGRLLVLPWLFLFQFNHRFNSTGWKFVLRLLMRRSSIPPLSSSSNNLESDVKCDQIMLVKPRNFAFDSFFDSFKSGNDFYSDFDEDGSRRSRESRCVIHKYCCIIHSFSFYIYSLWN